MWYYYIIWEHCIRRMSVLYTAIQILCSNIIILAEQLLFHSYMPFLHVWMLLYILLFYSCTYMCVYVCPIPPQSGIRVLTACAFVLTGYQGYGVSLKDVHWMCPCIKCLTVSLAYYTDLNYNGMDITCYSTQSLTVCVVTFRSYKVD